MEPCILCVTSGSVRGNLGMRGRGDLLISRSNGWQVRFDQTTRYDERRLDGDFLFVVSDDRLQKHG